MFVETLDKIVIFVTTIKIFLARVFLLCSNVQRMACFWLGGGGVLDIYLGGEVRHGPSYPV